MPRTSLHLVQAQPSWSFRSDRVAAHLTQLGGHLAPVSFELGHEVVQPFSIAPWAEEKLDPKTVPLLKILRGDFFCCPFGGNSTPWRGEEHPVHGESAAIKWTLRAIEHAGNSARLHASLSTTIRRGRIDKFIELPAGHTAIYQRHIISGMSGPMPVGHHPMIKFPEPPDVGLISVSRFVHGQVYPGAFENPESRGYQSLKPGATFRSLDRVPKISGGFADLSRYPARQGYEDLVMLVADPKLRFAWSAVAFPNERYVWFSLRDPRVLRNTVFWISNGGRHYAPWSGRHVNVMGIEDTTSHFHDGMAESARPNALLRRGFPTVLRLDSKTPTTISHIMAVTEIPRGFDHVADIRATPGGVRLRSRSGKTAACKLNLDWIKPQ